MYLIEIVNFLVEKDELVEAKQLLKTFEKYAFSLEQYDELAMLYEKTKSYEDSICMLDKCMSWCETDGQKYSIYANYAKVYNHLNNPDKSLYYSDLIFKKFPNNFDIQMEMSFSHYLKNDISKSYDIQNQLLQNPEVPLEIRKRIRFNMGSFQLMKGNFKSGIRDLIEGGRAIKVYPNINSNFQRWNGNKETKATVLVYAEAGIGDEIINVRFMNEFKKYNMNVIWYTTREDLAKLFKRNGIEVITNFTQLKTDRYVMCEAMSLPILFDLDLNDLWDKPYLEPSQKYLDKWKLKLPEKFITVRWSGNPYYDQDLHRTVDRDLLINSLRKYDLPLVSLQIDSKKVSSDLIDVDIESWEDTLAIQKLALINVTSCTSTGHSASAIGARCVILPPIATYYTWLPLKEDNTSYWYGPNTKIFPQKRHKNWIDSVKLACKEVEVLL